METFEKNQDSIFSLPCRLLCFWLIKNNDTLKVIFFLLYMFLSKLNRPNRHRKHFRFLSKASFKAGQKVSGDSKGVQTTQKVALPELSSLVN